MFYKPLSQKQLKKAKSLNTLRFKVKRCDDSWCVLLQWGNKPDERIKS